MDFRVKRRERRKFLENPIRESALEAPRAFARVARNLVLIFVVAVTLIAAADVYADTEKADLVIVEKSSHRLSLYKAGKLLASYHAMFGGNPGGAKEKEGDGKTPEGRYVLDNKKNSQYHKAFHISYPNAEDIKRAKQLGVAPGGDVMVHGQKNGFGWASFITQRFNWTKGCIALSNDDIDAMWDMVGVGTVIEIRP